MQKILIIAEIGHNHNGNLNLAFDMIAEAKNCGADIVKFQLYDTDEIKKPYQSRYWELKYAELQQDDVERIILFCEAKRIEPMFSVFDAERLEWCEHLNVKRYKIASRSANDHELIDKCLATKKQVIVSCGMVSPWTDNRIDFLYCVSEYPAYLVELPDFGKQSYELSFLNNSYIYSGFSDHTIGCYWAREAIKRGAKIIEKHFTISRSLPGYNQKGSADPTELKDLVRYARQHERGIQF